MYCRCNIDGPVSTLGEIDVRPGIAIVVEDTDASANISALSSLVAATVGSPLIKVAAFSYGVRSAFAARRKPGSGRRSR